MSPYKKAISPMASGPTFRRSGLFVHPQSAAAKFANGSERGGGRKYDTVGDQVVQGC